MSNMSLVVQGNALPSPSNFAAYARAVAQIEPLTAQQEQEWVARWNVDKDPEAAKALVLSHLYLVVKLVRNHQGYGVNEGDLAQEGTIGLMKAVHKFDTQKGVRLATYAWYWIEAEIKEFILKNWRMISWGTSSLAKKLFFGYRKTVQSLREVGEHRAVPNAQDIAHSLGVSEEDAEITRSYFLGGDIQIFDEHEDEEDASRRPSAFLSTDATPEMELMESQTQIIMRQMKEWVNNLPARQQQVIKARFLTTPPQTLSEISKTLGVSVERVRQIEADGIKSLQRHAQSLEHHVE